MVIFVSDFDLSGSGYMQIAISLCSQLTGRDHQVMALGIGYNGSEHNWPFSIIPVRQRDFIPVSAAMMQNLRAISQAGVLPPIDAIVVALDIPLQDKFLGMERGPIPYVGIFPVESGPVTPSWANILAAMTRRLVISKYGTDEVKKKNLEATYLPIGIDTASWRLPSPKERKSLRTAMGFAEDEFIVLTVADNHERKNLWRAGEIIADMNKRTKTSWILVTRVQSHAGWQIDDMAVTLGLTERLFKYERGLAFDRLWTLYAVADAFLLTSKAEGLCMPVLEAMATGVPVAGTYFTAVPEHLYEDPVKRKGQRGFPIEVEYVTNDPWGNSFRAFPGRESGVQALSTILKWRGKKLDEIVARARAYAESRTPDLTGATLDGIIRSVSTLQQGVVGGVTPMTVPRLIPSQAKEEA